jgi:transposase-like protein
MILYGLFGVSNLARAVAHWFQSQDNMTMREVAKEFGVNPATLMRAVRKARKMITDVAVAEKISAQTMLKW